VSVRTHQDRAPGSQTGALPNGVTTFDLTEPNARRVRHPMALPQVPAAR